MTNFNDDNNVKGDKGEKGEPGNSGIQGPRGIQGNIGPRGYRGIQGDIGPEGKMGPSTFDFQNQWRILPFSNKINLFYESIYSSNYFVPLHDHINIIEEKEPYFDATIELNPKNVKTIGINFNGCTPEPSGKSYENIFKNNLNENKTLIIQGYTKNCNDIKIKNYAIYTIGKSITINGRYTYIHLNYQLSNMKKFEFPESEEYNFYYRISIGEFYPIEGPLFEHSVLDESSRTLSLSTNLEILKFDNKEPNININEGVFKGKSLSINEIKFNKETMHINEQINIDSNLLLKGNQHSNVPTLNIEGNTILNEISNNIPALTLNGSALFNKTLNSTEPTLSINGTSVLKNILDLNSPTLTLDGFAIFNGNTKFKNSSIGINEPIVNIEGEIKADTISINKIKSDNDITVENNLSVKGVLDGMIGYPTNGDFNNSDINNTDSIANAFNKLLKILSCIADPPRKINAVYQQKLEGNKYEAINCYNGETVSNLYAGNDLPKLRVGNKDCQYYLTLTKQEFENRDQTIHEEIYAKELTQLKASLSVINLDDNLNNNNETYTLGSHTFNKLSDSLYIDNYKNLDLEICHMNWHKYKCFDSYVSTISPNNAKLKGQLKNSNTLKYKLELTECYQDGNKNIYPNVPEFFYLDDSYLSAPVVKGPQGIPALKIDTAGPKGYIGSYVSGIPVMTPDDRFNCIFTVDNSVNMYHPLKIAEISGNCINTVSLGASHCNPPITYPLSPGTLTYNNIKIPIIKNCYEDILSENSTHGVFIMVKGFNTLGEIYSVYCSNLDSFNNSVLFRIDTISQEPSSSSFTSEKFDIVGVRETGFSCRISNELNGEKPNITWPLKAYNSEQSIVSTQDLQIVAGQYQYPPNKNYTNYDPSGPNYSNSSVGLNGDLIGVNNFRYATFYLGRITNKKSITINFTNTENLGDSKIIPNFSFNIKILSSINATDNPTEGWLDGNSLYLENSIPDGINGLSALDTLSTSTKKIINFGDISRTGELICRVGISRSSLHKIGGINILN